MLFRWKDAVHVSLACVWLALLVLLRVTTHFLPYKVTLAIKIFRPIQHSTKKK